MKVQVSTSCARRPITYPAVLVHKPTGVIVFAPLNAGRDGVSYVLDAASTSGAKVGSSWGFQNIDNYELYSGTVVLENS